MTRLRSREIPPKCTKRYDYIHERVKSTAGIFLHFVIGKFSTQVSITIFSQYSKATRQSLIEFQFSHLIEKYFLPRRRVNIYRLNTYELTYLEITFNFTFFVQRLIFSMPRISHVQVIKSSFFYRYIWKEFFRFVVSSSSGHFSPAPSRRGLCH